MSTPAVTPAAPKTELQKFEGFLEKAGHVGAVALKDVVKYVVPFASVVAEADPALSPEVSAFNSAVSLVQKTVITIQAKWASAPAGTETNAAKLADVITIVEDPIVALFKQSGKTVDTAYVTNLINSVVGLLNAQPAALLGA